MLADTLNSRNTEHEKENETTQLRVRSRRAWSRWEKRRETYYVVASKIFEQLRDTRSAEFLFPNSFRNGNSKVEDELLEMYVQLQFYLLQN